MGSVFTTALSMTHGSSSGTMECNVAHDTAAAAMLEIQDSSTDNQLEGKGCQASHSKESNADDLRCFTDMLLPQQFEHPLDYKPWPSFTHSRYSLRPCNEVFVPAPSLGLGQDAAQHTAPAASWHSTQLGLDRRLTSDSTNAVRSSDCNLQLSSDGDDEYSIQDAGSRGLSILRARTNQSRSFRMRHSAHDISHLSSSARINSAQGSERAVCSVAEAVQAAAAAARAANASPRLQRALERSLQHSHGNQRASVSLDLPLSRSFSIDSRRNSLQRQLSPALATKGMQPHYEGSPPDVAHASGRPFRAGGDTQSPRSSPMAHQHRQWCPLTYLNNAQRGEVHAVQCSQAVRVTQSLSSPGMQQVSRLVTATTSSASVEHTALS